ncbi:MAG: hypothetical protein Q7R81_06435 [Candidatus Peregrinibacteria bacterium]|nr:hypothetical protein [Candidatus Peregrinibacteria bacterium]
MATVRPTAPLVSQSLASTATVLLILAICAATILLFRPAQTAGGTVELGVEHTSSLSLNLSISADEGQGGIAELSHDSQDAVAISTPDTWHIRQVRHATLDDIQSDPASFGFTRHRLPSGAIVSFRIPQAPLHLVIHNPSMIPLKVHLKRIHVKSGNILDDVILIQQEKTTLW